MIISGLSSCVSIGYKPKPSTIKDITGIWEGNLWAIVYSYCRLEINPDGSGFFIAMSKGNDFEIFKIELINFDELSINISLIHIEDNEFSKCVEVIFGLFRISIASRVGIELIFVM